MHRILLILSVLLCSTLPAVAFAQEAGDDSDEDMRSRVQKSEEHGVAVHRPDGWVFGDAGKGVVALMTVAGDTRSQIELRVSSHVKKDQRKSFFASFHANLQKAGFEKVDTREDVKHGGKEGKEIEYETGSDERKFSLIVWQYHDGRRAFLVVGFFPEEARSVHYEDFKTVVSKLEIFDPVKR